jgi:Rod binding domain-containing protein
MFIEGMSPLPISQQAAAGPSQAAEEAKLKEACQQFEEMFLTQMMKQMRKTAPEGGMFGGSQSEKQFEEMLDQERAKSWAADGGVGMAQMMFEQMKKNM